MKASLLSFYVLLQKHTVHENAIDSADLLMQRNFTFQIIKQQQLYSCSLVLIQKSDYKVYFIFICYRFTTLKTTPKSRQTTMDTSVEGINKTGPICRLNKENHT